MNPKSHESKNRIGPLDTLAQKRTSLGKDIKKAPLLVNGKGSDLSNLKALHGRAKRKTITQVMALNLVNVATRKKKPERAKAYRNAYYCQRRIITDQGKLYGKYCKNRFCTLCCSIRKAVIINKYYPVIKDWKDCHFVTLTIKAIPANQLRECLKDMLKTFARIIDKYRKRYNRGKGFALVGIKSLECNFNADKRTYNPHFHVLVLNKEMGEILIKEWLLQFDPKTATRGAQFIRKVENKEKDLIEIVKYGSKIFTEPQLRYNGKRKITPFVFVSALDNILSAMAGLRIFDRFGFNLPAEPKRTREMKTLSHYDEWVFALKNSDWINPETGEILAGYQLSQELQRILRNNIELTCQ